MQYSITWFLNGHRSSLLASLVLPSVLCLGCGGPAPLTVDMPLHLEDHLDAATIVGSEVPANLPQPIEWRFDDPQPEWQAPAHRNPYIPPLQMTQTEDALRITLSEAHRYPRADFLHGAFYVPVPALKRAEWDHVLVRARSSDDIREFWLGFNLGDPTVPDDDEFGHVPGGPGMFQRYGDDTPVIHDGSVQTYLLRADWSGPPFGQWEDPWQELGFAINAGKPSSFDILSISMVLKAALYADAPVGLRTEVRNRTYRRTLYSHAPGRLEYRVRVPEAGRLDIGLGVLRDNAPVTFTISAGPEGEVQRLLEETHGDPGRWAQHSVDLSHLAGQTVPLVLEADAERPGTVALWAAPTLSGTRTTDRPNIIFYVIDGGGADYMSVYGYNRRTTPNLERIAAEGALFERAYSNSSWTRPSTASFMTSLQHSVLGGFKNGFNVIPDDAPTMAQHMHRAGYQTAVFTSNPNAGRMSNLERGVDVFREVGVQNESESSVELHENFWRWRDAYPGEPYWVHFQTTDVHAKFTPPAPFAGLYISPERRRAFEESRGDAEDTRVAYAGAGRDLYDETMAHQDYQVGQLVARLKTAGEWERTLLIIASDHGAAAGSQDWAILMRDVVPPNYDYEHRGAPIFRSGVSRIPMIFVWPGHILPGQRFSDPVSMVDVLPTILDLADLPMPEVMQGQSLAPLLLGKQGWEPRPVILDEFDVDGETGELRGRIEVIDRRWGASLQINPDPEWPPEDRRPAPLLLYDLWNDPMALWSLHEERPDLVQKYTVFLEEQFEAHMALSQFFTRSGDVALTPEQLQTLRTLGYIQ